VYRSTKVFEGGMMEIRLDPDLSHCIETVAKREYERILSILLRAKEEDSELAEELELLRVFLESADFSQLRNRCEEYLLAGTHIEVRLRSTNGVPGYELEINEVECGE
jgi:hypothetical protein